MAQPPSRLAAAWFNADPPPSWHATTAAGETPAASLSPRVRHLLAGTPARDHLDDSPPRQHTATAKADLVVAVDYTIPGAHQWSLAATGVDETMRDELSDRVATLTRTLTALAPPG
jgi:hypothetical protein